MSKESSVIKDIAIEEGKGLVITFQSGDKYLYPEATKEDYVGLMKAESKGSYFAKNIRKQNSEKLTA